MSDKYFIGTNPNPNPIPEEYMKLFEKLLNDIETKTGKIVEITLKEFGSSDNPSKWNHTFGDINKRSKIQITTMDSEYSELWGVYSSFNDCNSRIKKLQIRDKFENQRGFSFGSSYSKYTDYCSLHFEVGQCKKCHMWGNLDEYGNYSAITTIGSDYCANTLCPDRKMTTIWDDVEISRTNGDIIKKRESGIYDVIGHYTFIKS